MENYKDLIARQPKQSAAVTTLIDGVEATVDYSLADVGVIYARYSEGYTYRELSWLQPEATVKIDGARRYTITANNETVESKTVTTWYYKGSHIMHTYNGESREIALEQLKQIVLAAAPVIMCIAKESEQAEAPIANEVAKEIEDHILGY